MWFVIVVSLVALFIVLSIKMSPQAALGITLTLAMVFPAWLMWKFASGPAGSIVGTGVDVKVTVGAVCLLLYCFLPGRSIPLRLVPTDLAVLGLISVHLLSDISNSGWAWKIPAFAYAEWYLPYVAGRLAIQSRRDLNQLWIVVACLGLMLAVAAMLESWISWNPFEFVFGQRPLEGFSRDAKRWGLIRAYGPTMHPIYFGVMQLLFLGWVSYAAAMAFRRRAPAWLSITPLPMCMGIAATGSRGPILGIVAAVLFAVFGIWPKSRILLGATLILGCVLAFVQHEKIIQHLEDWTADRQVEISVDGETRLQSSARSRLNLIEVYRIALRRSGWLGFGSEAVAGFPINVPVGPQEARTLEKLKTIDNAYLLLTLRFGYLGLTFFLLAGMLGVVQCIWVADRNRGTRIQWFCICLGATTAASLLVLITVWMPHEIGFPLLFGLGISGSLVVAQLESRLSTH